MADQGAQQRREGSRRTIARDERRHRARSKRRRRNLFFAVGGTTIALMLIGALFVPNLQIFQGGGGAGAGASAAGDGVGTSFSSLGRSHVLAGTQVQYNSVPPTSGSHYDTLALWGVYESQLQDRTVVHNLEHGGVNINYNLSDEGQVAALREFVEGQPGFPGCFILQPHLDVLEGTTVFTSWQWLQEFQGVEETEGMQVFLNDHKARGPEFFGSDCGLAFQQ